jgi:hypothetical protein
VRQVVRALEPLGARILVAATTHDLADLASDQVMVAGVLPSRLVMGDVDLAVIAGGQGSVQTALAAGLPFVGIPLQSEQDANVTFAQNQGAARLIAQKAAGTPAMTPPHPTCSPTPPHATARAASRRPSPPPTAPPRQPRQSSRSPPPRKRPSGNCASP